MSTAAVFSVATGLADEEFLRWKRETLDDDDDGGGAGEASTSNARRREENVNANDADADADEDDDDDERGWDGAMDAMPELGRYERVKDYIAHHVTLRDRRISEDYVVYCLSRCEAARDKGNAKEEMRWLFQMFAVDVEEQRHLMMRGTQTEIDIPKRFMDILEQRLRRLVNLSVETGEKLSQAQAHAMAGCYYCYFKHDFEAALEHCAQVRLIEMTAYGGCVDESDVALEEKDAFLLAKIESFRVMRSTQLRKGNAFDALEINSHIILMARQRYHSSPKTTASLTDFTTHLIEMALVLRGWREKPARPLTAPELEQWSAEVLKEAKSELERFWTNTGTSWRDNETLKQMYLFVLCHLADLCDNHLDSHHVHVEEDEEPTFREKSVALYHALAVSYRSLAETVRPDIFSQHCLFCDQPVRDPSIDAQIGLTSLMCERLHHYHVKCSVANCKAGRGNFPRLVDMGERCILCMDAFERQNLEAEIEYMSQTVDDEPGFGFDDSVFPDDDEDEEEGEDDDDEAEEREALASRVADLSARIRNLQRLTDAAIANEDENDDETRRPSAS